MKTKNWTLHWKVKISFRDIRTEMEKNDEVYRDNFEEFKKVLVREGPGEYLIFSDIERSEAGNNHIDMGEKTYFVEEEGKKYAIGEMIWLYDNEEKAKEGEKMLRGYAGEGEITLEEGREKWINF